MRIAPLIIAPLLIAPALLLAGCEDGRDVSAAAANNTAERRIAMRNDGHDELTRLSVLNQRLAMMRAIRQTGHRCRRVDNAGYQEEYRNMRMWVAECGAEQKIWQVFIAPNRDIQVRDCADAGTLGLPRCEPLPPAAPVPELGEGVPLPDIGNGSGNGAVPAPLPRQPVGNAAR